MVVEDAEYRDLAGRTQMVGRLMKLVRDSDMDCLGLTSSQADCLLYISVHPADTLSGIRAFLGVSQQAVSALVDKLRALGLVTTEIIESDHRQKAIELTPKGRKMIAEIELRAIYCGQNITHSLTDEEIKELSRMLKILMSNLSHLASHR